MTQRSVTHSTCVLCSVRVRRVPGKRGGREPHDYAPTAPGPQYRPSAGPALAAPSTR